MHLLARDWLSREEKKKEPFVVHRHSEIHVEGVSIDLQLINSPKDEVHVLLNRTTFPQKYTHKPILSESTLNFTQAHKVSSIAHGKTLQQNTLNIPQIIIETR